MLQQFKEDAARLGLALTPEHLEQFAAYQALLLAWNQKINLTAVTEPLAIQRRHFLDSLTCGLVTGDLNGRSLIDVGSGAGFPGVPLKIYFPDCRLTLIDSVRKKTTFLQAVVAQLGLTRVEILTERAETLGQQADYREQFDWAVARAVAPLPVLAEYLLPLCRVGGAMLAQKGKQVLAELEAAEGAMSTLGGDAPTLHQVQLPAEASASTLVVVSKIAATPAKYPRRPGIPAKRPL